MGCINTGNKIASIVNSSNPTPQNGNIPIQKSIEVKQAPENEHRGSSNQALQESIDKSKDNKKEIKDTKLSKKMSIKVDPHTTASKVKDMKSLAEGDEIKITRNIYQNSNSVQKDYNILSKIGKGSFGSVFKVHHKKSGQFRAMKVIKKEIINLQDDDRKFLKEIEILIKADHPNIIRIYEYFIDEINYYLIMEYVSGGELLDTITNWKDFSEKKATYIMKQILSAVSYLHSNKIIHRDLKPENMLVENKTKNKSGDEEINIKIIDFGTCNFIEKNSKLSLKVGRRLLLECIS